MTATLDGVANKRKDKPEPATEQKVAEELVARAREQGVSLTGPDGLRKQLTKTVLETALNQELTEHLGHEKHGPAGNEAGNVGNGTRPKAVLTEASGQVGIAPHRRHRAAVPDLVPAAWRGPGRARRVLRAALWGREGSSQVRDAPVADPRIIRSLDVGQAAYIHRGGVTFVQVKRLVAAPAALAREPAPAPGPAPEPAADHPEPAAAAGQPRTAPLPDASSLLDEAFGKEPG